MAGKTRRDEEKVLKKSAGKQEEEDDDVIKRCDREEGCSAGSFLLGQKVRVQSFITTLLSVYKTQKSVKYRHREFSCET